MEYNLDENSNSEGYKNEDTGDNVSTVLDSMPDSSDIEVLQLGLVKFLAIILIWGMDGNGSNTVDTTTVTASANIPNWTTKFNDNN